MPQHPGIQIQFQGFGNGVILPAFVTRLFFTVHFFSTKW
jgi:hypothetical protein